MTNDDDGRPAGRQANIICSLDVFHRREYICILLGIHVIHYHIEGGRGLRRRSGLYLSVIIDNISSSSSGVVEHSKYFSNIYYFSLSLPLQVQPRVLLRYHHWRQARWTCRHDIAGRCRAQDGRELSCSLHWSVNRTYYLPLEFRMLLLLVLSSRSNHIIIIQSSSHTLSTYAYSYSYSHHHHVHRREGIWICRIILPPCHPRFHVPGVREDIIY